MAVRYGSDMYGRDVELSELHPELNDEDPVDYALTIGDRDDMTPPRRRSRVYGGQKYSKKRAGRRQR